MANIDIANDALLLLGERSVTALSDDSVAATAINSIFLSLRREMLRSAIWTFATKRTQLYVLLDQAPNTFDIGITYAAGNVVNNGVNAAFVSKVNGNIGNDPSISPTQWRAISPWQAADWSSGTTYATGEVVRYGTDVYASILAGTGHIPTDMTYWVDTGLDEDTPLFGFAHQYTVPTDFLRLAPSTYFEWSEFQAIQREGGLLFLSQRDQPMNLRYVYDFDTDSTDPIDPLFLNAFASRLAEQTCERITQSNNKKADAHAVYKNAMLEAARTNAIERGPFIPHVDDWVAVRNNWGDNSTSAAGGRLWPWNT